MSWRPRLFERSALCVLMCPWRSTARFMRLLRSSGISRVSPFPVRIWRTDFPVASRTFGTAYASLRRAPIAAFDAPSPWSFTTISTISFASRGTHSGFFEMNGRVEPCWPFLFAWILAMEATPYLASVFEGYAGPLCAHAYSAGNTRGTFSSARGFPSQALIRQAPVLSKRARSRCGGGAAEAIPQGPCRGRYLVRGPLGRGARPRRTERGGQDDGPSVPVWPTPDGRGTGATRRTRYPAGPDSSASVPRLHPGD